MFALVRERFALPPARQALVLDPSLREWPRSLEPAESRPEFVVRIGVEAAPARSAVMQAPGAQRALSR